MSDKKRKVPKLRFPGFTDEWEQRKLGELASNIYGGGTPATSNEGFWNGTIPWIQSSDLTVNQVFGVHPRKYITKAAVMNSATKIVPENSLAIITRVGVGKLAIMPFSYTTSQDFLSLSGLKTDVKFTAYLLYKRLQGELNSVQGTSIKGITKDELLKKIIYVPERREQEKIGVFFRNLDNLITLHQRKSENLQKLKKGLLQKMFPKNKECVPELRFPEFADTWEQRKLGDVTDYNNGTGHEDYVLAQGKYELITLKSINAEGKLVSSDKYIDEKFDTLKKDTLIMMLSEQAKGMLGMTTLIPCNNRYILNQRVAALLPHEGIVSSFLTRAINNKQNYFEQMGAGTKVQNISKGHVENCVIGIPECEEQLKIGEYFTNLDNLITLHQRKLEHLEDLKKGLLQQMFI